MRSTTASPRIAVVSCRQRLHRIVQHMAQCTAQCIVQDIPQCIARCIVHHMVCQYHMPQCTVQLPVLCTVKAAIAEFCPKSCDAAAIDFGCGVGKYLPLLAEHTVRCLPPALHRTLHSVICMHCIYTAYTLLIQCIHSTHTLLSANALHMYGACRRVWWASTSRVASSPSPARAVTPRGALHTACHVHSMVHCIAASMVHAMVRRCQRWVGGLVGWWVGGC